MHPIPPDHRVWQIKGTGHHSVNRLPIPPHQCHVVHPATPQRMRGSQDEDERDDDDHLKWPPFFTTKNGEGEDVMDEKIRFVFDKSYSC